MGKNKQLHGYIAGLGDDAAKNALKNKTLNERTHRTHIDLSRDMKKTLTVYCYLEHVLLEIAAETNVLFSVFPFSMID